MIKGEVITNKQHRKEVSEMIKRLSKEVKLMTDKKDIIFTERRINNLKKWYNRQKDEVGND